MRCAVVWAVLAGLTSFAAPVFAQEELRVHFPKPPIERHGTLGLEARVSAGESLEPNGTGDLSVQLESGPPDSVIPGQVSYTLNGRVLTSAVSFCRDTAQPAKITLSLRVKALGRDLKFDSNTITIDPLSPQTGENPNPCGVPKGPLPDLKVALESVSYTGQGVGPWWPLGGALHYIRAYLTADRDATVNLVVTRDGQKICQKPYKLRKDTRTPVDISAKLTDGTVLSVLDTATQKAVSTPWPLPRRYGPIGEDRDVSQELLIVFWLLLLALLSWIAWDFRWAFLKPSSVPQRYRAWRERRREEAAARPRPAFPESIAQKPNLQGEPGKTPAALAGSAEKTAEMPQDRPVTIEDLQNTITRLNEEKGMLQVSMNSMEEKLKDWVPPPPPPPPPSVPPGEYSSALLAVLNRWWQGDNPERSRLREMLKQIGLPAKFYTMTGIEGVMTSVSWNGPYSFQPSDKDGGWLWCDLPTEGDAIVLPADPAFFNTEPMQKILQRVVSGCETLQSKPRFLDASSPCKVTREAGAYRFSQKGTVRVEGQPQPRAYAKHGRSFDSFLPRPAPIAKPASDWGAAVVSGVTTVVNQAVRDSGAQILSELKQLLQRTKQDAPPPPVQPNLSNIESQILNTVATAVQKSTRPTSDDIVKIQSGLAELRKALIAEIRAFGHRVDVPLSGEAGVTTLDTGQPVNPGEVQPPLATDAATEVREAIEAQFIDLRKLIEEIRTTVSPPAEVGTTTEGGIGSSGDPNEVRLLSVADVVVEVQQAMADQFAELRRVLVDEIRAGATPPPDSGLTTPLVDLDEVRSCVAAEVTAAMRQEMAKQKSDAVQLANLQKPWFDEMRGAFAELSARLVAALPLPAPPNDTPKGATPVDVDAAPDGKPWWSEGQLQSAYGKAANIAQREYVQRLQAFMPVLSSSFPGPTFRLAHLDLTNKEFAIHPVKVDEDGHFKCDCGNQDAAQLFVTTESDQRGLSHVLVPPGELLAYRFPHGYSLLLDPVPKGSGSFTVGLVNRPAALKKVPGKANVYSVANPMSWSA